MILHTLKWSIKISNYLFRIVYKITDPNSSFPAMYWKIFMYTFTFNTLYLKVNGVNIFAPSVLKKETFQCSMKLKLTASPAFLNPNDSKLKYNSGFEY